MDQFALISRIMHVNGVNFSQENMNVKILVLKFNIKEKIYVMKMLCTWMLFHFKIQLLEDVYIKILYKLVTLPSKIILLY
jgi:uncharacterized protein Smg (DUF494 family)